MIKGNKNDVVIGKHYEYFRPLWTTSITVEIVEMTSGEMGVLMGGSSFAIFMHSIPEDALFSEINE